MTRYKSHNIKFKLKGGYLMGSILKKRKSGATPEMALLGLVINLLAGIFAHFLNNIGTANITLTPIQMSIVGLILALLLYYCRCKHRFSYGLAEVIFGVVSIWSYLDMTHEPLKANLAYSNILPLLGYLYIIVRGLDNIGTAIDGHKYEPKLWRKSFRADKNTQQNQDIKEIAI